MKTSVNIHQSFEIFKRVNDLVQYKNGLYKKKTQIFPTKLAYCSIYGLIKLIFNKITLLYANIFILMLCEEILILKIHRHPE